MNTYNKEELKKIFHTLPEDLKEAVTSVETAKIIQEVGRKHHLHVDQVGELANEIGLIMLGVNRPYNFVDNVAKRLRISTEIAREIVKEIDVKIFQNIRDSLQKIRGFEPESVTNKQAEEEDGLTKKEDTNSINEPKPVKEKEKPETEDIFTRKMGSLFKTERNEVNQTGTEIPGPVDETAKNTPPRHDPYREQAEK